MRTPLAAAVLALAALAACDRAAPSPTATQSAPVASNPTPMDHATLHTLKAKRLDGTEEALSTYAGKVVLVVNTASECGYTPQYAPLEALYEKYKDRGFTVLGFPSNDFGGQEPGSAADIAAFCKSKYGVTFPLFDKVKTKGDGQSPVYALLAQAKGEPKWNFHKYLVDKQGNVVAAWPSAVRPDSAEITQAIEEQLAR